jgi:hypothetical protein
MKHCPYCGKEYPDDAVVCAIDGESLTAPVQERTKVTGVWRGCYGYEPAGPHSETVVPFTLKLKQEWFGHFTGTVSEDEPAGMPGVGRIEGFFEWPTIQFTKQMPVGYIANPDGTRITLREYFIKHGHTCENEMPSAVISYEGTFLDANRVQGFWVIRPTRTSLPDGWGFNVSHTTGLWCGEFVTTDSEALPRGSPEQPFFDKSLLPEQDVLAQANSAFHSLGSFAVPDAEKILSRFDDAKIRFLLKQNDFLICRMPPFTAMWGGYSGMAPMIEIFVHSGDQAKAARIVTEDCKV